MPDSLWAFAYLSALFIVWDRKIKVGWIIVVCLSFFVFEYLQFVEIINGTADYLDLICYFASALVAFIVNQILSKLYHETA